MRKFLIPLAAVLLTVGITMTSCKKDDEEKAGGETAETLSLLPAKATVGTITETSAQITAGMDKKSGEITEKDILLAKTLSMKCGFCLVEGDGEPTISDTKIDCTESAISSMGKNMTGEFTGLKNNTKYTVRAWATYYDKTFYGLPSTFTTPEVEKFKSKISLDITQTYVDGCLMEAKISDFKDLDPKLVKETGFVIAEQGAVPDISDKKETGKLDANEGSFSADIHDEYYKGQKWMVAAYIQYDGEIYYSDPVEFETKKEIQLKITLQTPNKANGDIFTNGCKLNGAIEDYYNLKKEGSFGNIGVCYAVDKTPTVDDYTTTVSISQAAGTFTNNNFTDNNIKYEKITLRAYAEFDGVVYYSEPVVVQTLAFLSEITLSPITKTYSDGCDAYAAISDFADVDTKTMTESGFCICEAGGEPSTGDIKITAKPSSDGTLAATIHNSNISVGKWAVRAYVIFDGVTYYSEEEDFEIEKVDYGFDIADQKFHYGEHIYVLEEDFDPNNYDPVNKYTNTYNLFVKFSNIPSDYIEFKTVHDEFLGKHITGIIALQIMAFEIYNRDREDGKKCFALINPEYNMNQIMEWVSHRYDMVNPEENQPYLAATFLQGAHRTNFFTPTKVDNLYSIKFQADPDGKKQTTSPSRGDVFYVDIIAEGWDSQTVRKCRVVLWEKMIPKGGYYQVHDLSGLVLTAPEIMYDDNSLWPGLD